jgi:hypothetical protein
MTEILWSLLLISAVGAACYYGGWRACRAYLSAAEAVAIAARSSADQAIQFSATLDKVRAETASLRMSVDQNTEALDRKLTGLETSLTILYQGFERAGVVRSARPPIGKQVGEEGPQQS